jgi:hypothetical protein
MAESVIPSDRNLADALKKPAPCSRRGKHMAAPPALVAESEGEAHASPVQQSACGVDDGRPQSHRSVTTIESFRGGSPATIGRNLRPVEETEGAALTAG